MKYEYLFFNIFVLAGPLFFGSLKKFYFLNYWKKASYAIIVTSIPFILWDILVTDRHWFFAENYTLGLRIFGLPIEEVMFFFTVPYACLFTWQMVKKYFEFKTETAKIDSLIQIAIALIFLIFHVSSIILKLEYTAIATAFFALAILFDKYWGANIFILKRFWIYFIFVTFFTLVFNGYLTWRPIVTYDAIYQLDFRIFTIPIEDFFFGNSMLLISTSIFEKLLQDNDSVSSQG